MISSSSDVGRDCAGKSPSPAWRQLLVSCLAGALAPLAVLGVAVWHFGSVEAVYARVRGQQVYADEPVIVLRDVVPGSVHDVEFRLGNLGPHDATVLDTKVSCDCLESLAPTSVVGSGKRAPLSFRLTTSVRDSGTRVLSIRVLIDTQQDVLKLQLQVHYATT